jgi:hypothetical protein
MQVLPRKSSFLHVEAMRGGKDAVLDLQVVEQEIDRLRVAGLDAADLAAARIT